MTEVGGYRTLAQLGAASPRPLPPSPPHVETTAADRYFLPPPHATVPSTHSGGTLPQDFSPAADAAGTERHGTWTVPMTPILLPTPTRLVREGAELLRDWHPRDPKIIVSGRPGTGNNPSVLGRYGDLLAPFKLDSEPRTPSRPGPSNAPAQHPGSTSSAETAPAESEGSQRSDAARIAMMIGLGGGLAQNAIDVVRLVKKYPEAMRAGRFDPSLGKLGRLPTAIGLTALTRPDNRILDPTWRGIAASIETGGRTFDRFDDIAMKSSVLLGASLAAIQIGSSIPNLADALGKDGPWYENLTQSTSGRAGMLQLAGGTLGAAVFATALRQTAGQAGPGVISKVLAAASAPIMARPTWGRIGLATGAVVMANEIGFLDWLNEGETRPVGQVLGDATHKTPVLNNPELRTAAILGAGGFVGYKAHRAFAAAGGMSGLGKGHIIAGAIVAGLLGAQLLGGLSGMNKPPEPASPNPQP